MGKGRQISESKVTEAMGVIVGKWKPIILLDLIFNGTRRFNELQRQIPGITQKMLTAQLRDLESSGLINRVVYPEVPPRVEYSMTKYGRTLEPILCMMHQWGEKHVTRLEVAE